MAEEKFQEKFVTVKSKCCKKILLEVAPSMRGLVRIKCSGCGKMRIIALPIIEKEAQV